MPIKHTDGNTSDPFCTVILRQWSRSLRATPNEGSLYDKPVVVTGPSNGQILHLSQIVIPTAAFSSSKGMRSGVEGPGVFCGDPDFVRREQKIAAGVQRIRIRS